MVFFDLLKKVSRHEIIKNSGCCVQIGWTLNMAHPTLCLYSLWSRVKEEEISDIIICRM
jgi:hypothetical protein